MIICIFGGFFVCFFLFSTFVFIIFAFSALTLSVGHQEEHLACKN